MSTTIVVLTTCFAAVVVAQQETIPWDNSSYGSAVRTDPSNVWSAFGRPSPNRVTPGYEMGARRVASPANAFGDGRNEPAFGLHPKVGPDATRQAQQRSQPVASRQQTRQPDETANRPRATQSKTLESAQVIAIVGDQSILAGDILGRINKVLEPYVGKAPPEQLEQQRGLLVRQVLPQAIDVKLAYLDFLRDVPAENQSKVLAHAYKVYDEKQLPTIVKGEGVKNAAELDALLRRRGSSLNDERRMFAEMVLAGEATRRNAEFSQIVSHAEMLQEYKNNLQEYEFPAKARWEHLMARFSEHPSRAAAERAIERMGNEVLGGAPFSAVAKRSSNGATAAKGGQYEWTTKGSLASEQLDAAIFSLPVAHLSEKIEDERGFHIVRVIERVEAGRVGFSEVQNEIRENIIKQRGETARKDYVERLRNEIYVWTAFDDKKLSVANRP